MMTLEKFEEASELVKKVTNPTKLVYSEYLSEETGGKIYLKPESIRARTKSAALIIRSVRCPRRKSRKD